MFKKRKNKTKEDVLTVDNKQQQDRSSNISTDSSIAADENGNGQNFADDGDQVDGFDAQGFVDLTPAENQPKLLGPKQHCQYIGTFAVSLGTGGEGESTLTTHKERTRFVKKKLKEYRYAQKGVGVAILISTDGIKVISPDGQRVRMAHPLQRISFATCDPECRLFAYMSHNPSPLGTAIHCHVFMTKYTRQVQNLTALIGKAFQVAFTEKVAQGRRWKKQEKSPNQSPPTPRKQDTPTTAAVETSTPPSQASPLGRRRSFGKAHTPPEVRRSNIPQGNGGRNEAVQHEKRTSPPDAVLDGSPVAERKVSAPAHLVQSTAQEPQDQKFYIPPDEEKPIRRERSHTPPPSRSEVRRSNIPQGNGGRNEAVQRKKRTSPSDAVPDGPADGSPVAERKISAPAHLAQTTAAEKPQEQIFYIPPDEEKPARRERSHTPPPSRSDNISVGVPTKQSAAMSPLAKSASDPNLLAANELPGGSKHEAVSKRNSHEDENWYMPGIPREFVTEMLEKSEEGSFFVRDSQSRPGCYALTMRVPHEANTSGFGNFLIVKVKDGVMIQGFDKVLPDVTSLVEHYSQHADGLPCKLMIAGSNILCEDEEYMNIVPSDPDYQSLSDFTAMMAELK